MSSTASPYSLFFGWSETASPDMINYLCDVDNWSVEIMLMKLNGTNEKRFLINLINYFYAHLSVRE